jgi:FMN reductase (NADPH)/FMN reductase [NAD(P)H]
VNPTLELLNARRSTRTYAATPITDAEKHAILHGAMRAPTGGNMMQYSIIEVTDQALKDRLAVTCDDQPFIARAPWVLIFVADMQKWIDLFRHVHAEQIDGVEHRIVPGMGDFINAFADALIAAQNAVIAAESLGIGSCYIGDIIENAEIHAEMFDLPSYVIPAAMLCLGRPLSDGPIAPRYETHVVHDNVYRRLAENELAEVADELAMLHAPHASTRGTGDFVRQIYTRKYASEFMREMNRSAAWWMERWTSDAGL